MIKNLFGYYIQSSMSTKWGSNPDLGETLLTWFFGIWPLGRHGWLQLLIFDNFFLETNCKFFFFFFRKLISLLNNLHFIHVILISNNGSKACVQYAVLLITYLKQLILPSNKSMQTLYYLKLLRRKETQWSPCFRQNHTPKYRLKV